MKRLLAILTLLIGLSAFADSGSNSVMVHLNYVSPKGTHTNMFFECSVTISNQTSAPLTATNLFSQPPGLAMVVRGWYGEELARTYAWPLKSEAFTFSPDTPYTYRLWYGTKPVGISLPNDAVDVSFRIEGTLSGSSYTNSITSNFIVTKVP